MKATLPFVLSALLVAGCSKAGNQAPPEPASLVGGTWTWSSSQIETTPKAGGPTTVSTQTVQVGKETRSFSADGFMQVAYDGVAQPKVNYQFADSKITVFQAFTVTMLEVGELTAKRLVYTQAQESTDHRYRLTTTFTRN